MDDDTLILRVTRGHVTVERTYVYCWLHPDDKKVMYVGATWMHPAARAELHLHSNDENARIVGHNLQVKGININEPMQIIAFPVPQDMNRKLLKGMLINALQTQHLLSNQYFGTEPSMKSDDSKTLYTDWVTQSMETLRRLLIT